MKLLITAAMVLSASTSAWAQRGGGGPRGGGDGGIHYEARQLRQSVSVFCQEADEEALYMQRRGIRGWRQLQEASQTAAQFATNLDRWFLPSYRSGNLVQLRTATSRMDTRIDNVSDSLQQANRGGRHGNGNVPRSLFRKLRSVQSDWQDLKRAARVGRGGGGGGHDRRACHSVLETRWGTNLQEFWGPTKASVMQQCQQAKQGRVLLECNLAYSPSCRF